MSKKIKLNQQFEWLSEYVSDDTNPTKDSLLKKIKRNIKDNKWSELTAEEQNYMISIVCETVDTHARRLFEKYLGDYLPESFHSLNLRYMKQFQNILEELEEEIKSAEYGYLSEYAAFSNNSSPAIAYMYLYKNKYIVLICDEMVDGYGSDYFEDLQVFDCFDDANSYFSSLIGQGLKDGAEQISECLNKVDESENVCIKPVQILQNINFTIYYSNVLILEHMSSLSADSINSAIVQYKNYCENNKIKINSIYKNSPRSNQRCYLIEYFDQEDQRDKMLSVHIPSELQGQEQTIIDVVERDKSSKIIKERNKE